MMQKSGFIVTAEAIEKVKAYIRTMDTEENQPVQEESSKTKVKRG